MTWQNWAGTASADPARRAWPRSTEEIGQAIMAAANDGITVRALGSGHSFTPAAATSGVALDLSGWAGVVGADLDSGLVTVRSGTTIRELNATLDALGLAMANLGDIDAQTVAGAISTGTHGTGAGLGGIATQVVGLELVLADGSVVSCSAEEHPDLFSAARVSVGALGVLSTVTLECVPAFTLVADERPMALEEVLARFGEFAADNDHFEFYWFPYGKNALLKRNNRILLEDDAPLTLAGPTKPSPGEPSDGRAMGALAKTAVVPGARKTAAPRPMPRWRRFLEYEVMENAAFGALCRTGRAVPATIKPLNRLASASLSKRTYSAPSHEVFVTPRRVRFVESEYAIPREALLEVLRELRAGVAELADPVMFPVEIRVAAADNIWLSTAYGRESAYVAIHQYVGLPYQDYFRLFESIAMSVGGRPHWGKMHSRDAAYLGTVYPRFADFLRIRDSLDPSRRFANPYLSQVFGS